MSDDVIVLGKGDKDHEAYLARYSMPCYHCGDRALGISLRDGKPTCTECSKKRICYTGLMRQSRRKE